MFTQPSTYLLSSLLSYVSELAQGQRDCRVVQQEAPISPLAKRLPVLQDKTREKTKHSEFNVK